MLSVQLAEQVYVCVYIINLIVLLLHVHSCEGTNRCVIAQHGSEIVH